MMYQTQLDISHSQGPQALEAGDVSGLDIPTASASSLGLRTVEVDEAATLLAQRYPQFAKTQVKLDTAQHQWESPIVVD